MSTKTKKSRRTSSRASPDSALNAKGKGEYLADNVIDWIETYIQEHGVQVGDPLPTEEEIVRRTRLSRTSVREGLTRLRAIGVIDTRRKRGMRLSRSVALLDLVRLLGSSEMPPEHKEHVKSFRSAVELGLGPEIFRQCKVRDVRDLQQIYEQMVHEANNPDVWPHLDREFHLKLVGISGNQLAVWFHQLLDPFFRAFSPASYPVSTEILDRHRQIVEALRRRDPYEFEHALREHHLRKLSAAYEDDH